MVTICSYIANLVAFFNFNPPLTEKEKIQDVWALAEQSRIKYGTVQGGSTEAFFRVSIYSFLIGNRYSKNLISS